MSEKNSVTAASGDEPASIYNAHGVLNDDLALALSTGPQLNPLSIQAFKLYMIVCVAFIGSLGWGFDTSVMSGINGMSQFTEYFGISGEGGGQGIITALLFAIFNFGNIAASFVAGPVADRWGRKGGMFAASIILLAGISTVTAAQSRIYLFFGRFLLGFGSTMNTSSALWRGRLAGLYNAFQFVGSIVCSGLVIATGRMNSSLSWRIPCAIQFAPTVVLAVGVLFIPETRHARFWRGYHGNGDVNAPLVVLEWQELEAGIKVDGTDKRWWDYSELFNSRGARYRTLVISWMGLCYLFSGIGIFNYITVVFDLAGVKSQERRLIFTFVSVALGALGALFGASIVDKVGRRPLWLWGTAGCAISMALAAGNKFQPIWSPKDMLIIFNFIMNMVYMPLQGMYASECLDFSNRAKGLSLFALVQSLCSLCNLFAGSVAFQNIGWKYMLVPACWDVVETIVIYLIAVETKGRTLEELDEIFEDLHPVNASLQRKQGSREAEKQ
ncbi:general substrate transporter [Mycena albidolilacea]|uniref:General substrate transporter n=1 Tax=Mycena albidolilacea TaxID=1033008 RepID=A0AAD6ZIA6_9AGAR|nr:general substrate transporter [Mycena albidolilacea]